MGTIYDEQTKLWSNLDAGMSNERSIAIGERILKTLSAHGSKVAQVLSH